MNIILVSGASGCAKTFILDWRHWAIGSVAFLVVLVIFTLVFNFITVRWAAAAQFPWFHALVLADQREESARKVVFADSHAHYGKMLKIDHGNGLASRYAHASQLLAKVGDLVLRGQRVATVGSTGRSTGPHLHFEVRLNGIPQNPARFLNAAS